MTDGAYAYRALLDAGARLVNGSDAPVEELDPLRGLRAGVARSLDERAPWHAEQSVTVDEALRASTVEAAWLAYDEHRRGRLLPGMLADLVVLERDPYRTPPHELDEIEVSATMVGGRWVHRAPSLFGDPHVRDGLRIPAAAHTTPSADNPVCPRPTRAVS